MTLKNIPADEYPDVRNILCYQDKQPVFFGHYWIDKGLRPQPQRENACCLDYSAGDGGNLVCYRFSCAQYEKDGKLGGYFESFPKG